MNEKEENKLSSWIKYKIDNAFAGGTKSQLITLLIVLGVSVVLFGVITGILFLAGDLVGGMQSTLIHILDSSSIIGDIGEVNPIYYVVLLLITLLGIAFYGTFIGIISNWISEKMEELSKGHTKIIEEGHVVVLGFSDSIFTILGEMGSSNENWTGNKKIVVVDKMGKTEMEDAVEDKTNLIFRSGDPNNEHTLDIASVEKARIIIINNDDDFEVVRNMLALSTYLKKCGAYMNEKMPVITVMMHDEDCVASAKMAAGIHHDFDDDEPSPYEEKIQILYFDNILAHLFAQACRQPGLSWVISEICDYGGSELYIEDTAADGKSLDESFTGKTLSEINGMLESSIALGVQRKNEMLLNPNPASFRFEKGDKLVHLAEDDNSIVINAADQNVKTGVPAPVKPGTQNNRLNFLVLGWNGPMPIILNEIDQFSGKGSNVRVFTENETAIAEGENFTGAIDFIDPYKWSNIMPYLEDNLLNCKDDASRLTNIIVVSEENLDVETSDKKVSTTLLHLREYLKDKHLENQVTVTTEINLPIDQYLLSQSNSSDFIVGSEIASRVLVQVSNNPKLHTVFTELLSDEGSEFYLRSFEDYVDITKPFNFTYIQNIAANRGNIGKDKQEVAIGWMRLGDEKANTIIKMNPSKAERSEAFKLEFEGDTFDNYKLIVVAVD